MIELDFLSGKVRKRTLPIYREPQPTADTLKRLLLPQGELAQVHNGDPPIRYLAFIELRPGTERGNHFHKIKQEFIYMLQGEVQLLLEETQSQARASVALSAGDLVIISCGVAHTLRVETEGQAIEFSPEVFDPSDTYRYPVR